jgi:hypothetical protein
VNPCSMRSDGVRRVDVSDDCAKVVDDDNEVEGSEGANVWVGFGVER